MTVRLVCTLLVALALVSPARVRGAEWDPDQVAISSTEENASLGVSGRTSAIDGQGRVHLVFQKNLDNDQFQIWCSIREIDGTWTDAEIVSDPVRSTRNASATMDRQGQFHVVWEDITDGEGDIFHRSRSTDGTWGATTSISPAAGYSRKAVIGVDAFNRLHVAWIDGRGGVQRLWHSSASPGEAWSAARVLSINGVSPEDPNLDTDGLGTVHIVWTDRGTSEDDRNNFDVVYLRLDATEGAPINPIRLIDHPSISLRPFIEALDDGTLHLVWLDARGPSRKASLEIYYKRYLPGIGWGRDKRFTYTDANHGRPVVVAGVGQTLNVVWEDYQTGTPDIYYRQITIERGWDRDSTPLTADFSASQAPTILTMPDGGLMVFWTDAQGSGVFRVFAKMGTIESSP